MYVPELTVSDLISLSLSQSEAVGVNQGCPAPCLEEAGEGLWLFLDAALVVSWVVLSWFSLCRLFTGVLPCAGVIWHQIQHCAQTPDEDHKKNKPCSSRLHIIISLG